MEPTDLCIDNSTFLEWFDTFHFECKKNNLVIDSNHPNTYRWIYDEGYSVGEGIIIEKDSPDIYG